MLSIEEQKLLIAKFVKSNKNFQGNEDLFDDFCSEAMQKSYIVFNSVNSIQHVENYISKVVKTSILIVLKNYGRIRRNKNGYISTKEIRIADIDTGLVKNSQVSEIIEADTELTTKIESKSDIFFISELPDPRATAEEILITKDCLQRVANSVCVIHKEVPSQQFLDIFYLRYIKGYKQSEIGKQLGLSQSEISKRLMRLSRLISNVLDVTKG